QTRRSPAAGHAFRTTTSVGARPAAETRGGRSGVPPEARVFWVLRRFRPINVARCLRGTRCRFAWPRAAPRCGRPGSASALEAGLDARDGFFGGGAVAEAGEPEVALAAPPEAGAG